jgi:hypothetical protein
MKTRKPTTIVRVRKAGKGHAVVSVKGGGGSYRQKPCEQCPWRVDQTGTFPKSAFCHSAETAYDMALSMFSCHMSGSKNPATCAGFLLMNAQNNLAYRLSVAKGSIDPRKISTGGVKLYPSYRAMAIANGVSPDHPRLAQCRDNDGTWHKPLMRRQRRNP